MFGAGCNSHHHKALVLWFILMACFCMPGFSAGVYAQESSAESVSAQTITSYVSRAALAKQQGQWLLAAQALADAARLTLKNGQWGKAKELAYQALSIPHDGLTPHETAYLLINLGRTLAQIDEQLNDSSHSLRLQAFYLFNKATKMATRANDIKTLSYALGYTGELFETEKRYPEALTFTRRAIFHAQQADAMQSMFLWQWQRGRLLAASGQRSVAVDAYRQAIKLLPRFSLSSMGEISTGQLYLQLVDLLLKEAQQSRDNITKATLLRSVRDLVEQMKAAELRDYFQDECVDKLQAKVKDVSKVSATAVVIYPIMLEDRLELLLDFPNGEMKRYSVPVDNNTLSAEIHRFRRLLEKRTTNQYRPHGEQLYEWLIAPFEDELASLNIDTLVFVPDGALRTIPVAALYDGEQFLIEKYAIATTPGVKLTDPAPLDRRQIKPLYVGLSQSVQGFSALESVPEELKGINDLYDGKLLLDEDFTQTQFRNALADRQLNVLHIATHGKFSGDADSSFILTYDGRLSMNQLAKQIGMFKFREQPLELLVLSACETAQGDERAALGLSGMAIKAGARSVVGTLWKVDDIAASQLIRDFYRQLQDPQASRAVAMQRAQQAMLNDIRFRHPGYWSAYLLINGWL
ncbi:hypothetical protein MNBD_GAMMA17-2056 [hydrothermal vent metagenome]|uniref:CHAT domain-containing protein n=1 Tax=hydrothermal vent metagenome TaxID=652676 RepID=A0A3B1AAD3_9ZZZZ